MIMPNMKVGEVFEDGGLLYKVLTVNEDGTYLSTRTDEKPVKKVVEEKTEEKPHEPKAEVKKPVTRNNTRKK